MNSKTLFKNCIFIVIMKKLNILWWQWNPRCATAMCLFTLRVELPWRRVIKWICAYLDSAHTEVTDMTRIKPSLKTASPSWKWTSVNCSYTEPPRLLRRNGIWNIICPRGKYPWWPNCIDFGDFSNCPNGALKRIVVVEKSVLAAEHSEWFVI